MKLPLLLLLVIGCVTTDQRVLKHVVCRAGTDTVFASDSVAWFNGPTRRTATWRFYGPSQYGYHEIAAVSGTATCVITSGVR